jgi:tetratricopeptide (TPR) repeat protein
MASECVSKIEAAELVDKLYKFRDLYFVHHSIEQAGQKLSDIEAELKLVLSSLDKLEDKLDKADVCLFRGKALNVLPEYNPVAEEHLVKAIKLNPKLLEAWLHLGECYVKKEDVEAAKNCFLNVLASSKDKAALRNLSMVIRKLSRSSPENTIEDSIEKAKEAVQLDIQDGYSWYVLGNAYQSLFFAKGQNPTVLKQCFSAYKQAEKDLIMANFADLHYNWSSVFTFQLDLEKSIAHLDKATMLDPTWNEAKQTKAQLLKYLDAVSSLVATNGKLKDKKLQQMLSSLSDSDAGPLSSIPLKELKDLTLDSDSSVAYGVLGRVVCSLPPENLLPFTFCMYDRSGVCIPVAVHNLASGSGPKIGDAVGIYKPVVKSVCFQFDKYDFDLRFIRVENPMHLVINGKRISSNQCALTQLAVEITGD